MSKRLASLADPRLEDYRNVPDPELLVARGLFIAEGRLVVRRLLTSSRFTTRSLLLTPAAEADLRDVVEAHPSLPVYVVNQEAMNTIIGFDIHRGCLGVGERPAPEGWRDVIEDARTMVVLEAVGNADNVGAVFRNAAAFGAGGVLLGPACADPLYRKAIRTSMGAALQVPFAHFSDWPADLYRLREFGMATIALTPNPSALPLADVVRTPAARRRVALVLGHEGSGLSEAALRAVDLHARIPMAPGVDSLNVATTAAIALYDLGRGRT